MWWAGIAWAHVGDVIGGIDVIVTRQEDVTEAPEQVYVEANFGLLLPTTTGQGSWDWVCHEAITAPKVVLSPRYTRSAAGVWLATLEDPANGRGGNTLFRSADGCSWPAVASLAGQIVPNATFDHDDPAIAWAATATEGAANAVWVSEDGGATFAPAFDPVPDRRFLSVVVANDERWATATDEAGARLFLWHADGDLPWTEQELVGVPGVIARTDVRILAVGDPGEVWLVSDPFGGDRVLHATADGSFTAIPEITSWVNDAAWDGERLWVVRDATGLVSVEPSGAVVEHSAFPVGPNIASVDGTLWTAPSSYVVLSMLARSDDDGASFTTVAYPDQVADVLSCPAGTEVAEICAPLWDGLLPRIRGFDDPRPEETGDTGDRVIPPHPDDLEDRACGCANGRQGAPWAVLLAMALPVRRAAHPRQRTATDG